MLYVPNGESKLDYSIEVAIAPSGDKPSARIVSMQRIRIEPRL